MAKSNNKIQDRNVEFKISLYQSKFQAYHSKKQNEGTITLYLPKIWNECKFVSDLVFEIIYLTILERICLERGFEKIRMKKGRCSPCKMANYARDMFLNSI